MIRVELRLGHLLQSASIATDKECRIEMNENLSEARNATIDSKEPPAMSNPRVLSR
jgi:hypothetical protein